MKIVALLGSPRANGNTSYLIDQALSEANKLGIETEKIVLAQYRVAGCQGHDECQGWKACIIKDDMELIVQKLFGAEGVIISSPVYFQNVSAQLKSFIDRTHFHWYHGGRMKARSAGVIVVTTKSGIEETTNTLVQFIVKRSNIPAEKVLRVSGCARRICQILSNTQVIEEARRLGAKMAQELLAGK